MLRDSVVVVVVVVVVVRTRPRAIPLAMIAIRKILRGFPFLSRNAYGAPLGGPSGRRSSAIRFVEHSYFRDHTGIDFNGWFRPKATLNLDSRQAHYSLFQIWIHFQKLNYPHQQAT